MLPNKHFKSNRHEGKINLKKVLLIHPCIEDFPAYDFRIKRINSPFPRKGFTKPLRLINILSS
jgi:hypothetical protein